LEAHEYDVARWAEHPNTLGHLEAQERLFAARATQVRREFFGPRARCPLCGETPQQDSSGYAWPEGLSRHLEGRGNVGRCSVIDFAFTECRRARRQAWTTRDKEVGPATCHPDVPSYEYGEGECRSCHEAAWKSWHESIDGEVREWRRGSASKVAIRGPRTSACVATLLGVERIISTDSGVAMRYLAKIIHCRPRFRLRSTADVGKTEFTLLATGN
jgi:hypothetical protein